MDIKFDLNELIKIIGESFKNFRFNFEELKKEKVTGESGGGMVKVVMNMSFEVEKLEIDPEVMKEQDYHFLEDLIIAAMNNTLDNARKKLQEKLNLGSIGSIFNPFLR